MQVYCQLLADKKPAPPDPPDLEILYGGPNGGQLLDFEETEEKGNLFAWY